MLLDISLVIVGLVLMLWSADRFVEGGASLARHLGIPTLLVGIVILGFGTSAPEMVVSALSAMNGSPGLALGNAYGSNITNIALVLGVTALICPIANIHSSVVKKELPILLAITAASAWMLSDGDLSRMDATIMLVLFGALLAWSIFEGLKKDEDPLRDEMEQELEAHAMTLNRAIVWVVVGVFLLVGSSHLLVTGAVGIATMLGVSDLIIGLTVVAIGTSLPELAASIIAARKGESDIALGNVLGSNLFNTLAVVGIAGAIAPFSTDPEVITRDLPVMGGLTVMLFIFSYGFFARGRINRIEGGVLFTIFIAYNTYLIMNTFV